jgi:hypothetical protein
MTALSRQGLLIIGFTLIVAASPDRICAQEVQNEVLPPLGILFYTPATREALDEARRSGRHVGTAAGEHKSVVTTLKVNGMVIAKDGRKTAWVNGRTVRSGDELVDGLRVTVEERDRGLVRLKTPDKGLVKVKPGESVRSLLNEPLQPPAAMKAPSPSRTQSGVASDPDSLEARLERIPADVSLRDLISVLLATPEPDQETSAQVTKDEKERAAESP